MSEIQSFEVSSLWKYFKSIIPWHTSHRLAFDAKGVPTDIRVSVKGLPQLHHVSIGLDVDEKGKDALVSLVYAVSFLLVSLAGFLLATTVSTLTPLISNVVQQLVMKPMMFLSTAILSLPSWIGAWNCGMLMYVILYTKYHFNETRCKCFGLTVGSENKLWVPLCFVACKLFEYVLMGQVAYSMLTSAYFTLLRQF